MAKLARVIDYAPLVFPWPMHYRQVLSFEATGNLPRKSNQRRIAKIKAKGGGTRPIIIKSKDALAFEQSFLSQVPKVCKQGLGSEAEPLLLWAHVFYRSNRSDLSVELLKDLLEKAGVVSNDRWIKAEMLFGSVDRDRPRMEIVLYRILKDDKCHAIQTTQ